MPIQKPNPDALESEAELGEWLLLSDVVDGIVERLEIEVSGRPDATPAIPTSRPHPCALTTDGCFGGAERIGMSRLALLLSAPLPEQETRICLGPG